MEQNESELNSYYHLLHHQAQPPPQPSHHQTPTATAPVTNSPTNGILPHPERAPHMLYPHSVPSASEGVRKKRGRPRKYGTPEQAAAAKRLSSSSPPSASLPISPPKKKDQSLAGGASTSSKKSQMAALGIAGQGFTPHIITVAAGEDMAQKIMLFVQQSKREICILSASGSISNPSLRQPATSGGNITYEGRFDITALTGSFVRTELGGITGGLGVSLSSTDGQIIGGGVGGSMRAAGPVEVIVGTFLIDPKKDITGGIKGDASASNLPSPVAGPSISNVGLQSAVDSSGRIPVRGNDNHQSIGGIQFMIQPQGIPGTHSQSTDWSGGTDTRGNANYELTGRSGGGARLSPENGDYE
ncbi:hypothetical protein F0562_025730 [Nyssa sinensis]|uniref:AT-hook motif nuclear-localized protein n=1 Tax=Nyssa sinensis TaxID=561372 RepID=A0A5J5B8X8_9ASTE|nr:hypothetical protein F0562_025730 [Nyssa sinensis]